MIPSTSARLSPVRIYILWHPSFTEGYALARRLYEWFRLETMEGIPVFFRSDNKPGDPCPPPIPDGCELNYIIPLVEANMVASTPWRVYVKELLKSTKPGVQHHLLPVALDGSAYQMPVEMRDTNFIRHDLSANPDAGLLIGQLTEVICRHLRDDTSRARTEDQKEEKSAGAPPAKLRIFLSHAKADGTREPITLKEHIQGNTQCEAFFDETDLASGFNFSVALERSVSEESAGLIVVQGDNYADRPWCRKEIRDFLKPGKDIAGGDGKTESSKKAALCFIPPVIVVQTMKGARIGRTIPELGHAPCLRWTGEPDCARLVVMTLLREILLGLFYRKLARGIASDVVQPNTAVLNRTPDPVMVARLLGECQLDRRKPACILHPGYGLSRLENDGLLTTFGDGVQFLSFAEFDPATQGLLRTTPAAAKKEADGLLGKVVAISAGNAPDILAWGAGDEHNRELLQRLLRPLFCRGVSLLYGGALPSFGEHPQPWENPVNFTALFLSLLLSERSDNKRWQGSAKKSPHTSRLFNLSAWPYSKAVVASVRARWTDICSFITVSPKDAGVPDLPPEPVLVEPIQASAGEKRKAAAKFMAEKEKHYRQERLITARCLTTMRQWAVRPLTCTLPDTPEAFEFETSAHIFIGGKIKYTFGLGPGLFEEVLYALEAKRPVFLPGCTRGATGLLAKWFHSPPRSRPPELTVGHYTDKAFIITNDAVTRHAASQPRSAAVETASKVFDRLWKIIGSARRQNALRGIFRNGLSSRENHRLLTTDSYAEVCNLIWAGLDKCC